MFEKTLERSDAVLEAKKLFEDLDNFLFFLQERTENLNRTPPDQIIHFLVKESGAFLKKASFIDKNTARIKMMRNQKIDSFHQFFSPVLNQILASQQSPEYQKATNQLSEQVKQINQLYYSFEPQKPSGLLRLTR